MRSSHIEAGTSPTRTVNASRGISFRARYDKSYYYAFLIALLLCWSPSKVIGYAAPWVIIAWFSFTTRSHTTFRNLCLLLLGWLAVTSLSALLIPEFAFHSAVITLMTYGSFFVAGIVPSRSIGGYQLQTKMFRVARWTVLFQGTWGIIQAVVNASRTGTFDGSTGDAVAGTIRPFEFTPDLSNPMFAINMVFLLLLMLPSVLTKREGIFPFAVGMFSLILASVLHVLLFLGVAIIIALTITYPTSVIRKNGLLLVIVFALFALVASTVLSNNFRTLERYVEYTLEGRTQRAVVIRRAIFEMPQEYPWMPYIGLGPGQFSSRAALIGTGMYFGTPANPMDIPFLPEGMSEPFKIYVLDLWWSLFFDREGNFVHTMDNTSSTVQPFFSWLSLYTEFGIIAFGTVILFLGWFMILIRNLTLASSSRLAGTSIIAGVVFLFLLGMQENYWEVPQAILVGIVMLKAQYANLKYFQSK